MKQKALIITLILAIVLACNTNKTQQPDNTAKPNSNSSKGFALLESSCFSCHNPNANIENEVAPTMATIKRHYIKDTTTLKSFSNSLIKFVNNPEKENQIIPEALERYGLMPKLVFTNEQLSQIASYIYNTELEKPNWYQNQYENEKQIHKLNLGEVSYEDHGKHIAMSTKSTLGKNLKAAINSKGTQNALVFCNEQAFPLTDSMAQVLNAKIKRVTDKPRNPLNVANSGELEYIATTKSLLLKNEKPKSRIQEIDGKMVGYYPIITNKMCLQCHGKPNSEVVPKTLEKLGMLYPKDQATGYTENQLRGIWVVEMQKK